MRLKSIDQRFFLEILKKLDGSSTQLFCMFIKLFMTSHNDENIHDNYLNKRIIMINV